MTFLLYLCKVFLCSGILLGYYWLFLRNKKFHRYNRFYLLGTMIGSVLLPFIKISIQPLSPVNQVVYQTLEVLTVNYGESDEPVGIAALAGKLFTLDNLLYGVYSLGVVGLLVALLRSIAYIRRLFKKYDYEVINDLNFYNTNEPGTPFSFFRSIFWNQELSFNSKEGQQIFRHELFHIRQKHSLDVLLAEIMTALFWCNPFFYIIKKELKAIHEFLADQYAISDSDRYAYAELLVLQTLQARTLPLTHRFFQNHIKRRIAMITNLQNTNYTYWSRLMALPLSVLLFCSIALHAQPSLNAGLKVGSLDKPITVIIDAGHGGMDPGAASPDGKLLEKDLTLQISKKIEELAASYKVRAIMTRNSDELPGGAATVRDGLLSRAALASQMQADLYISIHISAADTTFQTKRSGFEVFITANNETTKAASTQLGSALLQSLSSLYKTDPVLKQRKSQGIWVLDRNSCPAALIECGYITNPNDIEYFSNSANQEAVAKKILEGIVQYASQPSVAEQIQDPALLSEVAKHFQRNLRYPQKAIETHTNGEVFFSIDFNSAGKLENFKLYDEAPLVADRIHEIVVVGYGKLPLTVSPLTTIEARPPFQQVVMQAYEKPISFSEKVAKQPAKLYYKCVFRIEN